MTEPSPVPKQKPARAGLTSLLPAAFFFFLALLLTVPVMMRITGRIAPNGYVNRFSVPVQVILWVLSGAAAAAGIYFLRRRPRMRPREMIFAVVPLCAVIAVAEVGVRWHAQHQSGGGIEYSKDLVWQPRANYAAVVRYAGRGKVRVTTGRHGFRIFGDPTSTRTRVLILGDSFTYAAGIPDGATYGDVLGKLDPTLEVFAFGGPGYGTLQEYMIMDRHIDEIKPHLIVWQFCQNDLINNSYDMETLSPWQNNHMPRPYLRGDRIRVLYPKELHNPLFSLCRYSYLLRTADAKRDLFRAMRVWSIEFDLTPEHPLYRETSQILGELCRRIKARARAVPVVAVLAQGEEKWTGPAFEQACADSGIRFLENVGGAITEALARGEPVTIGGKSDPHWSEAGHKLVAQKLLEEVGKVVPAFP